VDELHPVRELVRGEIKIDVSQIQSMFADIAHFVGMRKQMLADVVLGVQCISRVPCPVARM